MFLTKISQKELTVSIKNVKNKYSSDYDGLNNLFTQEITVSYCPDSELFRQQIFCKLRFHELLKESRNFSTV